MDVEKYSIIWFWKLKKFEIKKTKQNKTYVSITTVWSSHFGE